MKWNEILQSQHEEHIGEIILKELKKQDYPSGDFQHEVTMDVHVKDFNDEYIEIDILQECVSNWTEWTEHRSLIEYRMTILNRPKTKDDDHTIWDYPMVEV
jgi:hypothetical protein